MKKIIIKACIIATTIFLISSPITLSINIKKTEGTNEIIYQKTAQTYTNSKIIEIVNKINETMIRTFMEELLEFGPRMTSTYGCRKAGEYIYKNFEDNGLETRYHYWRSLGQTLFPRVFIDRNVIGTLPGVNNPDDEIIMFSAHYDSAKDAPGANDDGSGTVAVMAAAYVLSQYSFNRSLRFTCFSGEENGLLGAFAYAKKMYNDNDNLLLMIHTDMIGRATTSETGKTMGSQNTEDIWWLPLLFENISKEIGTNFNVRKSTMDRSFRGWSDHGPFVKYHFEAMACSQAEGDPNFHTPLDDINNVNISYLTNYTKNIVGVLAYLADFKNPYPQIKIANPMRGKIYFEDRVIKNLKYETTKIFDEVLIFAEVKPGISPVECVEFYYDGKLQYTDHEKPYYWRLNTLSIKEHEIKVIVFDEKGDNATDSMKFQYINLLTKK